MSNLTSLNVKKIISLTQLVVKANANVNVNVNEETKRFFKAIINLFIRYSLRS